MEELRRRLARDVDAAFPDLVTAMRDDLYGGLRRLHPREAEDLTQETLIRAYRALQGYQPAQIRTMNLRGWLWTIALNLGRNLARDRARRPQPVEFEDRHGVEDPELPDVEAWDARLSRLTSRQRRAVVLRHVVGLSYAEIADVLGVPDGTARADVHRGLTRLRTIMEVER
jgi:RNA polymerase sigma factor (sigma-70 family)